jgi:hypothetical protein
MKLICVLSLVAMSLGCGYSKPMAAAPTPGVVPTITQLMPNAVASGGPGFTLTVNGNGFGTTAVVNMGGTQQNTTYVTANQLAAMVPASAIATPGTVMVTVTNPATGTMGGGIYGGSGGTTAETSNSMTLTIQ